MAVNRIEGTRPVDTASTVAHQTPRSPAEVKKHAEGDGKAERVEEPKDDAPKRSASTVFKPYTLSFRFDEELNRVVVKVIDPETGEAVREIPPEAVLEALKKLKSAPGSLVDAEA